MNNTALAVRTDSMEELQTIGQVFVKSGYFQDTRDAAQAIVKVMAGAELGFPAIASMTGVYIVKGKVNLSANLMAAAIKRSGKYNYRVRQLDDTACQIEFFENGESIGVSSFTMAEAKAAKLHQDWDKDKREWKDKPTWKNFPRNMLFARALSNGAKWFCPDIFGGPIYTPDELGVVVDGETGEVIEAPLEAAPQLSEVDDASVGLQFPGLAEPEPEPVRPVKLEGAQPTDGRSDNKTVNNIMMLAGLIGWDGRTLADEVQRKFKTAISDENPAGGLEAMPTAQLKELLQVLQAEKRNRERMATA